MNTEYYLVAQNGNMQSSKWRKVTVCVFGQTAVLSNKGIITSILESFNQVDCSVGGFV